jgi:hypothetical protein
VDVVGGVQMMRDAVDQVLATGKPTYCIASFPFRPLGHASDGSPASDALLLAQFTKFKETLVNQICAACDPGTKGDEVASQIEACVGSIDERVVYAMSGNRILTRPEIAELSAPGTLALEKDPGAVVDVPRGYLLNKGVKSFAGMGAEIFARALSAEMTRLEADGRDVRYIHQENHAPNKTDTRGGVYGELNQVDEHHLRTKFISLLPNEAQIAQLGGALRAALGDKSVVIVKGPHTLFNEHAKDSIKYAAFRHVDTGEKAGHIYLVDGGNLCERVKETVQTPDGEQVREFVMARVGEHHNTAYYSGYMADANTTLAVPLDMNHLARMLPSMVELQDHGRMVMAFLPTSTFGYLHPAFPPGVETIGQNDVIRVRLKGGSRSAAETSSWSPGARRRSGSPRSSSSRVSKRRSTSLAI